MHAKYVLGDKLVCQERGCGALVADRDFNGSLCDGQPGYCSVHQRAQSEVRGDTKGPETEGVAIARNRRHRQQLAPTTGQPAGAESNQTGFGDQAKTVTWCGVDIKIAPKDCTRNCGGNKNCGKNHHMEDTDECECG